MVCYGRTLWQRSLPLLHCSDWGGGGGEALHPVCRQVQAFPVGSPSLSLLE